MKYYKRNSIKCNKNQTERINHKRTEKENTRDFNI